MNEYLEDYTDFYPEKSEGWEKHGDGYVKGGSVFFLAGA